MGLILIDSSVWIDHIRSQLAELSTLLSTQRVVQHPFATGEVALGSMANRERIVATLASLPQAVVGDEASFLHFVQENEIAGTGLGFVDCHLLVSAKRHQATLWTRDKRLHVQAERLGLAYIP